MSAFTDMLPQIGAVFGAIGGVAGIGTILRYGIDRRKGQADAAVREADGAKILSDTAVGLLEPYRDQLAFLGTELQAARLDGVAAREESRAARKESEALRTEVHELRNYIALLVATLTGANAPVPPEPASLAVVRDTPTDPPARRRRTDRA